MKKTKTFGEEISPILEELEIALWEFDVQAKIKPNFSNNSLRAACKIFMAVMMDKMFDLQEAGKMSMDDRYLMSAKLGAELRIMVKKYTAIDTFKMYGKEE